MSTAYHPQTDGQTERVNQVLEQYLRCYSDANHDDWSMLLTSAEFAYNNVAHEGTKYSPFYLEYGRHPRAGPTLIKSATTETLDDLMSKRLQAQEQAKAALTLAAERMKWYYDKGVQSVPFEKGQKVLVNLKDYQKTERALNPRYEGPFTILEKLSPVTFKLDLPPKFRAYHPVFHASKLATYQEPTIPNQGKKVPKPVRVGKNDEYLVDRILQHKVVRGKTQYLVRWKGFGQADDTWEPETNIQHAKAKLRAYQGKGFEALVADGMEIDEQIQILQRDSTLLVELVGGKIPTRGSEESAGLDLTANETTTIPANQRKLISTGVKIKLPIGTYGRIAPRSGLATKGISVDAGVIDRDYTGEIRVLLVNKSDINFVVNTGDRIAQLIVERIAQVDIEIVDQLEDTTRGTKGFGSTGTK